MWLILDERERVDAVDEQEGQHKQNMVGQLYRSFRTSTRMT